MPRITVNETVTRSVSFENNLVDVQTALDRCFQFLEEKRFDEAHAIIEQILNIDPNNTDAHVANFLYQFKLTCAEDVVKNFKDCGTYEDSVFYKRVKRSEQTEFAKNLDSCLGRASEQLAKFNFEEGRRIKEEEQRKTEIDIKDMRHTLIVFSLIPICWVILIIIFWPKIQWVGFVILAVAIMPCVVFYIDLKEKRQKQLDQQKTDQAAK